MDVSPQTLATGTATGFVFTDYTALGLAGALERALAAYADRAVWARIVQNGMSQDWSWDQSARHYADLYARVLEKAPAGAPA